jgi:decaprenylphospho-beta-D-ribofuranose 2-oxidase
MKWKTVELTGWGRALRARSEAARPERLSEVFPLIQTNFTGGLSIYGGGRSYGDSALNEGGHTCLTQRLDRILGFDETTGVIEVEPGVTFRRLLDVFLPRGWLFPVAPGTGLVTIGGAVANDIHGKNHEHAGTFGQHVSELDLLTPAGKHIRISPATAPEIFRATCGGCGLTGLITRIAFKMRRVPSAFVELKERRVPNLEAFIAEFEVAKNASYSVGWIDALAGGASLGRGILQIAEPASVAPPDGGRIRARKVPLDFPSFTINALSMRAFNAFYLRRVPKAGRTRLVSYANFLHPLDAIEDWNRVYGRKGFHQFQCVVPYADGMGALKQLLEMIAASRAASALTVLKRLGPGRAGYLSFPLEGYTLALDFPNRAGAPELYRKLVDVTLDHGGRVYLAKDALLSPDAFERMYPELPIFRGVLAQLDPEGNFQSDMARRLKVRG